MRSLTGKVEVLENRVTQSNSERDRTKNQLELGSVESGKKIQILQDEVGRLQDRLEAMSLEMAHIKAAATNPAAVEKTAPVKNSYELAEDLYSKKDWKKAILNYQKFRDANPKHKLFAEATYKIGVSFQELGMKDEARTFFDEVVGKFPGSSEAKKARTRLKSIKK
jgi:TolA-binding protein